MNYELNPGIKRIDPKEITIVSKLAEGGKAGQAKVVYEVSFQDKRAVLKPSYYTKSDKGDITSTSEEEANALYLLQGIPAVPILYGVTASDATVTGRDATYPIQKGSILEEKVEGKDMNYSQDYISPVSLVRFNDKTKKNLRSIVASELEAFYRKCIEVGVLFGDKREIILNVTPDGNVEVHKIDYGIVWPTAVDGQPDTASYVSNMKNLLSLLTKHDDTDHINEWTDNETLIVNSLYFRANGQKLAADLFDSVYDIGEYANKSNADKSFLQFLTAWKAAMAENGKFLLLYGDAQPFRRNLPEGIINSIKSELENVALAYDYNSMSSHLDKARRMADLWISLSDRTFLSDVTKAGATYLGKRLSSINRYNFPKTIDEIIQAAPKLEMVDAVMPLARIKAMEIATELLHDCRSYSNKEDELAEVTKILERLQIKPEAAASHIELRGNLEEAAILYEHLGNLDKAFSLLVEAAHGSPSYSKEKLLLNAGSILEKKGDPKGVMEFYANSSLFGEAGRCAEALGLYPTAFEYYLKADGLYYSKTTINSLFNLLGKLNGEGTLDLVKQFRLGTVPYPHSREEKIAEGIEMLNKSEFNGAGELFQSVRLEEIAALAFIEGKLFGKAGEIREAQRNLGEAYDLFMRAEQFVNAAGILERQGRNEEAIPLYIRAEEYGKAGKLAENTNLKLAYECYIAAGDKSSAERVKKQFTLPQRLFLTKDPTKIKQRLHSV